MKKRILSLALALVMALGLCATTAWAEETELTMENLNGYYKAEAGSKRYELNGGSYKLGGNITLNYPIKIYGTVTLNLNGYTISQNANYDTLILVDEAVFTLTDSVGSGKIYDYSDRDYYSVELYKNSTFCMQGGTVETVHLANENAKMCADGGTVTGITQVESGTTITTSSDTAAITTFEGNVVNYGTISGGTFKKTVSNTGIISGGTFCGKVVNGTPQKAAIISGGTFYGEVENNRTIEDSAYVTVTADGTAQKVLKGQKLTKPEDPVKEGYTFGGWYTDEACTEGNEYNFDTSVTEELILYAKWTKNTPEVTPRPSGRPTTTTTTDTTVVSAPKTGDVGAVLTGALAITSLLGMGYVGKKR